MLTNCIFYVIPNNLNVKLFACVKYKYTNVMISQLILQFYLPIHHASNLYQETTAIKLKKMKQDCVVNFPSSSISFYLICNFCYTFL